MKSDWLDDALKGRFMTGWFDRMVSGSQVEKKKTKVTVLVRQTVLLLRALRSTNNNSPPRLLMVIMRNYYLSPCRQKLARDLVDPPEMMMRIIPPRPYSHHPLFSMRTANTISTPTSSTKAINLWHSSTLPTRVSNVMTRRRQGK